MTDGRPGGPIEPVDRTPNNLNPLEFRRHLQLPQCTQPGLYLIGLDTVFPATFASAHRTFWSCGNDVSQPMNTGATVIGQEDSVAKYDEIPLVYIDISAKPAFVCWLENAIQVSGWFNKLAACRQLVRLYTDPVIIDSSHKSCLNAAESP